MWSDSEFRAKARTYFARAERSDNDEETFLWCALGLEFLLRAPLAALNPVLLADPVAGDGMSALHAAGLKPAKDKEPMSVTVTTVIKRLTAVVADFTPEDEQRATFLMRIRNRELHTSDTSLGDVRPSSWMPQFGRLLKVLSNHFKESPTDYLEGSFWDYVQKFVDEEVKRVRAEVEKRISDAKKIYDNLSQEERTNRQRSTFFRRLGHPQAKVACRACGEAALVVGDEVRLGAASLDGDTVITTRYNVAREFSCTVCGLSLNGMAEISAAGVRDSWTDELHESLEERYGEYDPEPDYGND